MDLFSTWPDRLPSVALRVEGPVCESFSADQFDLSLQSCLKYAFCICLLHMWLVLNVLVYSVGCHTLVLAISVARVVLSGC